MDNNNPAKIYIKRDLEELIKKYLPKPEIIAITGPRQSGKTTLIKHIFSNLQNANYISFDDFEILRLFLEDIKAFADLYVKKYKYLFIDEFQYAVNGGKNLKYIYDNFKTKIIITGSSSIELGEEAIKFLAGRIFIFTLYPLSFGEFLSYKNENLYSEVYLKLHREFIDSIKKGNEFKIDISNIVIKEINRYLYEFINFGGFPRVVLSENKEEKMMVLKNIYSTYILKEVKEILHIEEDFKLEKLIKALALQIGSTISYNELSLLTGFNYNNLIKYINILEKTFICSIIRPYYKNKRIELVKSPKVYFIDTGFRNVSLNNFAGIENRNDAGALFENFVISELLKENFGMNFWRTKSGAEVDLIMESDGKLTAIEIKTNLFKNKTGRAIYNFIEKYKPVNVYFLSLEYTGEKDNIKFLPISIA